MKNSVSVPVSGTLNINVSDLRRLLAEAEANDATVVELRPKKVKFGRGKALLPGRPEIQVPRVLEFLSTRGWCHHTEIAGYLADNEGLTPRQRAETRGSGTDVKYVCEVFFLLHDMRLGAVKIAGGLIKGAEGDGYYKITNKGRRNLAKLLAA